MKICRLILFGREIVPIDVDNNWFRFSYISHIYFADLGLNPLHKSHLWTNLDVILLRRIFRTINIGCKYELGCFHTIISETRLPLESTLHL